MSGLWILVGGALAVVFTSVFGPAMLRSKIRRRLRSGSPVLADGATVTLSGTVRDTDELIEAPLSTRRGVYVHAVAMLPEADVDGPVTLRTQRMVPFELDTEVGVVLVDGTEADATRRRREPASSPTRATGLRSGRRWTASAPRRRSRWRVR